MTYLKEWLKTILYMNVFLLIFENLVKTTHYEKYFRFFSGFLMMLCLLKPLVDLSNTNDYMDASFIQNELKNELRLIGKSEDLREIKGDIQKTYDKAIENQIKDVASSYDITVTKVQIRWKGDSEQMDTLDIKGESVSENNRSPDISSLRDILMDYYHLEHEDIHIEIQE